MDRIFSGVYPTGIVFADRKREVGGDYKRLAFLDFRTLTLEFEKDCPTDLKEKIAVDAANIQVMHGQDYQISTSGQKVKLGGPAVIPVMHIGHLVDAKLLSRVGENYEFEFVRHHKSGATELCLDSRLDLHIRAGERFTIKAPQIERGRYWIDTYC